MQMDHLLAFGALWADFHRLEVKLSLTFTSIKRAIEGFL